MKSFLRRLIGKSSRLDSTAKPSETRSLETEILEPRMLFSAAPVEAPDAAEAQNDAGGQEQAAEESVVTVDQTTAQESATTLERVDRFADLEQDRAQEAALGESTISLNQSMTLVNTSALTGQLNQETLDAIAEAAAQRWRASGLSADQEAALDALDYSVANTPNFVLGEVAGASITVDDNAGGRGWFIDATPLEDEEFLSSTDGVLTGIDGAAERGLDLLTVLMHEQGHILGIDDQAANLDPGHVMTGTISAGLRRTPDEGLADGFDPGSLEGEHFIILTNGTPDSDAGDVVDTVSSFTVAAGTDRLLVVFAVEEEADFITDVSYNGSSLTFLGGVTGGFGQRVEAWYTTLGTSLTPTTSDVVMTTHGGPGDFFNSVVAAVAYDGVNQTTPIDGFTSGTSLSLGVTSEIGDLVLGAAFNDSFALGAGPGQTAIHTHSGVQFLNFMSSSEAGLAGSVTMSYTGTPSTPASVAFNINATAGAPAAPEIYVEHDPTDVEIADGDVTPSGIASEGTDFSAVDTATGSEVRTFLIRNDGTALLTLSGQPSITGDAGGHFTESALIAGIGGSDLTLDPGDTRTFTVTFDPTADGVHTATVNIGSDDGDEAAYDFAIVGEGTLVIPPIPMQLGTPDSDAGDVVDTVSSFTVDAGDDRILVVFAVEEEADTISDVSFTGSTGTFTAGSLTFLGGVSGGFGQRIEAWYTTLGSSASSTTADIVMTTHGGPGDFFNSVVAGVVYKNVDQTTPIDGFTSGTSLSLSVISEFGDLVVGAAFNDSNALGAGADQTAIATHSGVQFLNFMSSEEAGAPSVTMDYTGTPSTPASVAFNLNAAATGPTAVDDDYTVSDPTDEDTPLTIPDGATDLLSNDSGFTGIVTGPATSANGASVTINADGSFTYDPTGSATLQALDEGGMITDTFTYTITSGSPLTPGATLNFDAGQSTDQTWSAGTGNSADDFVLPGSHTLGAVSSTFFPALTQAYTFPNANSASNRGLNDLPGDPSDASATWEFVVKPSDTGDTNQIIYETGGGGDGMGIWYQKGTDSDGTGTLNFTIDDGGVQQTISSPISNSDFSHIVAVYHKNDPGSGGNDRMELFINGVSAASDTSQTALNDWDGGDNAEIGGVAGGGLAQTVGDGDFSGEMAIFRFYEQPLTAGEIGDNLAFLQASSDTATVSIKVNGINDAPNGVNDSNSVTETADAVSNPTATGNVLTNDTDVDDPNSSFDVSAVAGVGANVGNSVTLTYGSVVINGTGTYTYTLDDSNPTVDALRPGETLTDTVQYTVRDNHSGGNVKTDTANLLITINGANDSVDAVDDPNAGTTDEDNSVVVAGPGVVGNDTNPESTPQVSSADTVSANGATVAVVQQSDIGEVGQALNVDGTPQTINFGQTYSNPVVVALSSQSNGAANFADDPDAAAVRIFNVTATGFDVRLDVPPSGSPAANPETVNYLVVEAGEYELANGFRLKADTQSVGVTNTLINFGGTIGFGATPVVLSQVMSDNDSAYIKARHQAGVSTSGVTIFLEEAEAAAAHSGSETVGYIAIEPGQGTINGVDYEVGNTPNSVTHAPYNVSFVNTYGSAPLFVADQQTIDGVDPSGLRFLNNTGSNIQVFTDEDRNNDTETGHADEVMGYFAYGANSGFLRGVELGTTTGGFTYDPTGVLAIQALDAGDVLLDTFDYTVTDGSGSTDAATATVTVNGLNDAPELGAGTGNFGDVAVNDVNNNGELVSDLVNGQASDVDASATIGGIAVTGTNTTVGTGHFEFSEDGGGSWNDIVGAAETNALLLLSTDRIRFVPDGTNIAMDIGELTFRAWDQTGTTTGQEGMTFDVTSTGTGGTTPFSDDAETATVTVANIVKVGDDITYNAGTGEVNDLRISFDPATSELVFFDANGNAIVTTSGTGGGTSTVRVPVDANDDLTIDTADEDDKISINSLGIFAGNLTVIGGDGHDMINYGADGVTLASGNDASFNAEQVDLWNSDLTATDGDITVMNGTGGASGNYQGIHLLNTDLTAGGTGSITLAGEGGDTGSANQGVQITNGSTVTTNDGDIDIDGTGGGGGALGNGVDINSGSTLTADNSGNITIDGTSSTAGTVANNGVYFGPGTGATVENGDLTINGTGDGTGVSRGIYAPGGLTLTGTGTGNITLTGTSSSSGTSNSGILLSAATVTTATGSGSITLTGTGSTSGTSLNDGVKLSNTDLTTGGNAGITIDGTGGGMTGGSGVLNVGVSLAAGSTATANGSGAVTINGTGGSGTSLNKGVVVGGVGASVSSGSGAITINGTGNGTVSLNRGIETSTANISTTGAVTLTGTGSTSGSGVFNSGIYLLGSASTSIGGGTLTITGNGGDGTSFNEGVRVVSGALSGTLTLMGTADATTSGVFNSGVYLLNANFSGATGSITGVGGGGTGFNHGIYANPAPALALNGSTTDGNANSKMVAP